MGFIEDNGASITRFNPLSKGGKAPRNQTPWKWQLRISVMSLNGQAWHRQLLEYRSTVWKPLGITIEAAGTQGLVLDQDGD